MKKKKSTINSSLVNHAFFLEPARRDYLREARLLHNTMGSKHFYDLSTNLFY